MKKKSLLILLATMGLLLSACGGKKPSSESSEQGQSESETSEPAESDSESGGGETINHQAPFVSQLENPSTTRQYRDEFDGMIEDFSSATPSGQTTGAFTDPFLRVLVDSKDGDEPITPDASIYKMATGTYEIEQYEGIGFTMRVTGNKSLKLSNLVLGLRGDDAWEVYQLKLSEALDPDQEALPELTEEFQDIIISPQQSLDGDLEYQLISGGNSGTKILDQILGFHLFASYEECSAVVEIKEVFLYQTGTGKTVLDSFDRQNVGKADATCWWRGSTGFIVQKGVTLKNGQTYTTRDLTDVAQNYENIVLNIMGDTTGTKIAGTSWANLKDNAEQKVANAVNGAFFPLVINPVKSQLNLESQEIVIESTTEIVISMMFATNLQDEAPVDEYPLMDYNDISIFDDFDRTMNIAAKYEEGNSEADQKIADADLYYSYGPHGASNLSIDGHALHIAGGEYDYVQLNEGSQHGGRGYNYLVLVMKGEDFSGLRISFTTGTEAIWSNQWVAASGLPTIPTNRANYVYNLAEGFAFYIIDIARSGFKPAESMDSMDIYYTGTHDLDIEQIYFANEYDPNSYTEESVLEKEYAADSGWIYGGYIYIPSDVDYLKMIFTSDDPDRAIDKIRLAAGENEAKWFHDGGIYDKDGKVISGDAKVGTYVIDLVKSGLKAKGQAQDLHVHGSNEGMESTIGFEAILLHPNTSAYVEEIWSMDVEAGSGYTYVNGYSVPAYIDYIKVDTNAGVENLLRFEGFEGGDKAKWLNAGSVIDINGNVVADGSTSYVIDLLASGLKESKDAPFTFHVHAEKGSEAFNVTISTYEKVASGEKVTENNFEPITSVAGYAYVGGFNVYDGARYIFLELNSTNTDLDLSSLRIEGLGGNAEAKWVKNGQVKDASGHAIDPNTKIGTGIALVIDLEASGIKAVGQQQYIHIHFGDSAATGDLTATAGIYGLSGSYYYNMIHSLTSL